MIRDAPTASLTGPKYVPMRAGNANAIRVDSCIRAWYHHATSNSRHGSEGRMEANYYVHPSSYVDIPCEIGEGTKIWHFCHIMPHAKIGAGCNLGQNVLVSSHVEIGNNV